MISSRDGVCFTCIYLRALIGRPRRVGEGEGEGERKKEKEAAFTGLYIYQMEARSSSDPDMRL